MDTSTCCKKFLYIEKQINKQNHYAFVPSRCKSWSCPSCRELKAKRIRAYIKKEFADKEMHFSTFTFFHSGSVLDRWKNIGKCWNRLRTYITKYYGKFSYLRVIEPHKKGGWPHVHVISTKPLVNKKTKRMLTKWGFGWSCDERIATSEQVGTYISKYLTKEWPFLDAEENRVLSKCRVVSVSKDMPAIFRKEGSWTMVESDIPGKVAKYLCNSLINELLKKGSTNISCEPFFGGFYIVSDVYINKEIVDEGEHLMTWIHCKEYFYEYHPNGEQCVLRL